MTDLRPHIKAHGTADLLPCPFCGGLDLGVTKADAAPYFVFCNEDECEGPYEHTPEEAVAAWNRRASALLPVEPPAAGEPVAWIVSWRLLPRSADETGGGGSAVFRFEAEKDAQVSMLQQLEFVAAITVVPLYTAPAGDELLAGLREAAGLDSLVYELMDALPEERDDLERQITEIHEKISALLAKHGGGE